MHDGLPLSSSAALPPADRRNHAPTRQRKGGKASPAGLPLVEDDSKARSNVISAATRGGAAVTLRQVCRRERLVTLWQWIRRYPWRVVVLILVVRIILRPSRAWKWTYQIFGRHYLKGGSLGNRLERWSMQQAYRTRVRRQKETFRALGMESPDDDEIPQPFRVLDLPFGDAERTLMWQRERRAQRLARLEQEANNHNNNHVGRNPAPHATIPQVIFVPRQLDWLPPRPGTLPGYDHIYFDDNERKEAVADACPKLVVVWDSLKSEAERIHLWSLCVVYHFGGVFLGDRLESPLSATEMQEALSHDSSQPLSGMATLSGSRIRLLAASPRHPIVHCVLDRILQRRELHDLSDIFAFPADSPEATAHLLCSSPSLSPCCEPLLVPGSTPLSHATPLFKFSYRSPDPPVTPIERSTTTAVFIDKPTFEDSKTVKRSIDQQLRAQSLQPSWFCMRCLKMPTYGTPAKCSRFCPPLYVDFMCQESGDLSVQAINVSVSGRPHPDIVQIPKIIHQTWFEDINLDRYPQLVRIQNSWKQTGWEYRLYTDETARQYIVDHFPAVFTEAFDTILPGAYKADLFRYLVLMKEGGVYSDVDVLLETNLDRFLRPGLSFFVPRDVVGEFADEAYCLWNGLIGAVPGHPIIVRSVERLVNHILERADVHDMERALCQNERNLEVWKVHGQPLLLLSGPCALGVAMNEALGRSSLAAVEPGWTTLEVTDESGSDMDYGDALVLLLDKHDLGGFRFSDPDRNLIVGSTNLNGLDKTAREVSNPTDAEKKRQHVRSKQEHSHYSDAAKGTDIWGSEGIYKDKLVTKLRIKFNVNYT